MTAKGYEDGKIFRWFLVGISLSSCTQQKLITVFITGLSTGALSSIKSLI
jgi:hypothetical protein